MKKFIVVMLFLSIAVAQQQKLTILHWNDFHAQNLPFQVKSKNRTTNSDTSFMVGGSATIVSYIKKYDQDQSSTIVLNAGDDFQGSPISTITKGNSQIQLLNLIKPDAMALGNHEFDYGRESLKENIKQAQFPVLSANLYDTKSNKPFAGTYIIKQIGTAKAAIIGLMTTELSTLSLPTNIKNLQVKSLSETVNSLVPELKKNKVDIIIALTHQGVTEDSVLAINSPDLDIIIGGHSHTPLFKPKYVNGVLIAQAGTKGRWLGKVDVTIDTDKDTITQSYAELIECRTADINPDSIVANKVSELEKLADKNLSEVIAELKSDWIRSGKGESNIGDWICDAMRTYAKADIAFQNSGGIRKDVLSGNLTVRDFWEISPFGNTLVTFSVTGETLLSMLNHQLNLSNDFCQISGMTLVYKGKDGNRVFDTTLVGKNLLDKKRSYSIVTNNYVAEQSNKYFGIELRESDVKQLNVIDRDILIDVAKSQKVITSVIEGRIKEIKE